MRVVHCISGLEGGGAERQVTYLADGLSRIGWDVDVITLGVGPNIERLRASDATWHRLHARGNRDPWIVPQLARVLRQIQPDLVQVWLLQMEILAGLAATVFGIPWILSERSSAGAYPPTLKHRVRRAVATRASAIVANSREGAAYWDTRIDRRIPRFVIPNAVPSDQIDAAGAVPFAELGVEDADRVVLFVGRLDANKNVDVLLPALRRVLLREPRAMAVICGEGPLRHELRSRAAEYGIAHRVRLPGYVPDVWRWMKRADVLVAPSLVEGEPNVVLEAVSCACPVVASDTGAHRAVLQHTSARLVEPCSAEMFAAAILSVLAEPDVARANAVADRSTLGRRSILSVARRYAGVYEAVLAGRGVPGRSLRSLAFNSATRRGPGQSAVRSSRYRR